MRTPLVLVAKAVAIAVAFLLVSDLLIRTDRVVTESKSLNRVYYPTQTVYGTVVGDSEPFFVCVEWDGHDTLFRTDSRTWTATQPGNYVFIVNRSGWLLGAFPVLLARQKKPG